MKQKMFKTSKNNCHYG